MSEKAKLDRRVFFGALGAVLAGAAGAKFLPKSNPAPKVKAAPFDPMRAGLAEDMVTFVTTTGPVTFGSVTEIRGPHTSAILWSPYTDNA